MAEPRITILVPSIGRMEYLPLTRRCANDQTRKDFRILILDNASPPEARAFFADWAKQDPRVEVVRADTRLPMFTNFNRGMRAVKTELVTFFHDDDFYEPDYLEVLIAELDRFPQAAFSGSNWSYIDETGAIMERRRWIERTEHWDMRRYMEELVGRGRNPVSMPGLVFRRDAFPPEGFDEEISIHYGDFIILLRAAEDRGMVAVEKQVVRIRKHSGQASAQPLSMLALRTELMSKYLDDYAGRHPEDHALVAKLRKRIALTHRTGLVWGWLTGKDAGEREHCLELLGDTSVDVALRRMLGWADKRGLRPTRLGNRFVRVARATASALRL